MDKKSKLRVISVDDPRMCMSCNHAHIAEVLFTNGSTRKMFYCSRLDCDNWKLEMVEQCAGVARRRKAA